MSTKLTTVGKLRYDQGKILGQGSFGTVFSGFRVYPLPYQYGSFSRQKKYTPVAVKRIERGSIKKADIQNQEELMKKASNHPNILNHIHTEMNKDFL